MTTTMGRQPQAAVDVTAGLTSLCAAFQRTVARVPDAVAIRYPAEGVEWTYGELDRRVRRAAAALARLGVRHGDAVASLMLNRPEHLVADLAALHLGATPFSLYATSSPEQLDYIVGDSGAQVVLAEPLLAPRLALVADKVKHLVTVSSGAPELDADDPEDFDFDAAWRAVGPDDLCCIVYTSGTTGPPKGAEISHGGELADMRGTWMVLPVPAEWRHICFLPLAHIMERGLGYYSAILFGGAITMCPDPANLPEAVAEVRPTVFAAPPRVWEKFRAKCESLGAPPAAFVHAVGLQQVVAAGVGAAPVPVPLLEWWQAAGVPLVQGWGMTETGCVGAIASQDPADNGTCGRALPGLEMRLAEDGELLVRGPMIIKRYRNLPDVTAEAIDPDGWLHTGDVAAIDDQGRMRIVDRKKELIISAGGKNMSPANIEAEIKSASALIGQAVAIGDDRPYNVALIVLDPDVARTLPDPDARAAEVARGVAAANERLSRVEQVKRYVVLDAEWLPGGDELTPTMKLKRRPIAAKYAAEVEALYRA